MSSTQYTFLAERLEAEENARILAEQREEDEQDYLIERPDGSIIHYNQSRTLTQKVSTPTLSEMVTNRVFNLEIQDLRRIINELQTQIRQLKEQLNQLQEASNNALLAQIEQPPAYRN